MGYFVIGPMASLPSPSSSPASSSASAASTSRNPDAAECGQGPAKRTLDIGYDGWMHDFGEYLAATRSLRWSKGRRGHNISSVFPQSRFRADGERAPRTTTFFVRSGTPARSSTFRRVGRRRRSDLRRDEGCPRRSRGLNLSMSGVPTGASDMTASSASPTPRTTRKCSCAGSNSAHCHRS